MAKRKEIINLPDVSKQNYELIKSGIFVYPEYMKDELTKKWSWYVFYSDNGKVTRYNKTVATNELNLCIHLAIIDRFKKLIKK